MHDVNDLVRAMQQVSVGATQTGYPADVMSGTVVSANPLKIKVEQRFDIESPQLIVPERLTDHNVSLTYEAMTEKAGIPEHRHNYGGTQTVILHSGLKSGEHVILIRQQGGQKFLVVDRVV